MDFKINDISNTVWGATLIEGSIPSLLQRGEMKSYTENTSRTIDGKIVSIKNPRQDARTFSIDISIKGNNVSDFLSKQNAFFNELESGLVTLNVPKYSLTFKLVYKKNNISHINRSDTFAVYKIYFDEPNPTDR